MNDILDIDGVLLTPLKIMDVEGGNVFHGMRSYDPGFAGFGEAYFSSVESKAIKAWKRHHQMVLNLIVPLGSVRFVIYDTRQNSSSYGKCEDVILSQKNYYRLTVPPMLWLGFQGMGESANMLLNIANITHSPEEVDRKEMNEIKYDWGFTK